MLVTETVASRAVVARELIVRDGEPAVEAAANQVVRELIAFADERAWKVRPESVHIRRLDGKPDEWAVSFEAIWSPRSARFVGGEYDGDQIDVPRQRDGRPLSVLTLPYRGATGVGDLEHPAVTQNPAYTRSGIDPISDVWVYTIRR